MSMTVYDRDRGTVILNPEQEALVEKIKDWYYHSPEQTFQFSGAAGTGKSTVIIAAINALKLQANEVAPMSFIGAATVVMRIKGLWNAKTIHSWLYEPYEVKGDFDSYLNRNRMKLDFKRKPLDPGIKLIVVDEAAAVPGYLRKAIESENRKVLVCGDVNQLPPFGGVTDDTYLYHGKVEYLTQIMRQNSNSTIPRFADEILHGIWHVRGMYGNVCVMYDDEVTDEFLANMEVILCHTNAKRDEYNRRIREDIFGFHGPLPQHGEKLICRKNNWGSEVNGISLTNGLIGTVCNYPSVGDFDGKTFGLDFKPNLSSEPFFGLKADYNYFTAPDNVIRNKIKNDPLSDGDKFEFAYALTVHVAQGSQYSVGAYIWSKTFHEEDQINLDYTAVTRFVDRCFIIIPREFHY